MFVTHQDDYRHAFLEYLRKGTPIRLRHKQDQPTGRYVWRTQNDDRVRSEHRANDGQLFEWASPPATGHPGTDYGCRCEAVPYIQGKTEYAHHTMQTFLSPPSYRYGDLDFVSHYYYGDGRALTLDEIGHLQEIAEKYAYSDGDAGAFRRLSDQIADAARQARSGAFTYPFSGSYEFGSVEFSHGGGTVSGQFSGTVTPRENMLHINGQSDFFFRDIFADPLGIGLEAGGTPYDITGRWSASFAAEIFSERDISEYATP